MTTMMKIPVPSVETYAGWKTLDDARQAGYQDDALLTIVQRYFDAQQHAISYRKRAALKGKLMKAALDQAGITITLPDSDPEA